LSLIFFLNGMFCDYFTLRFKTYSQKSVANFIIVLF
jgi:hypothetical protein